MTGPICIATRAYTLADQLRFAAFSGDRNPMHLDPIAARRTQAGAPVVHGIHLLLWGLDKLAETIKGLAPPASIKVRFDSFAYVGDTVALMLLKHDAGRVSCEIRTDGTVLTRIALGFGPMREAEPSLVGDSDAVPAVPVELDFPAMAGRSGAVGFANPPAQAADEFPHIARLWDGTRVAALAATSCLVGMICPGLHSIYGGLTVDSYETPEAPAALAYRVASTDSDFRVVRIAVRGGGIGGTIDSFARLPPVAQAGMAEVARLVHPDEFAGAAALVVGASRGLGELVAKIVAAGGGHVLATFAAGRADAERVRDEIRAHGGRCDIAPYDVLQPASQLLDGLPAVPTHLYYFATPRITRGKSAVFVASRFSEFCAFYVSGFYDLCQALLASGNPLTAFYPSTVFVEARPGGLTEYAMAKRAGEALCEDLAASRRSLRVIVSRLPRLPTDQTASFISVDVADPLSVMLREVRRTQAAPDSQSLEATEVGAAE